MDLSDWLEMPVSEDERAKPEESPWLDWTALELTSGKLGISDPQLFPSGAVIVVLRPQRYEIQAKLLPHGSRRVITRARVHRGSGGARGKVIGQVSVDGARIGFCDFEVLEAICDRIDDVRRAVVARAIDEPGLATAAWSDADDGQMPILSPGSSERDYEVFELVSGDRRVGAEIVFAAAPFA